MKKQKALSLLLAVALMIPMCIPIVGAEDVLNESKTSTDIVINSTVHLPKIKVTIDAAGDIIANPYHMSYKPAGAAPTDPGKTDPIITTTSTIKSNSTIAMDITATPSLTTTSNDLNVLTAPITDTTKKSIYLRYNMKGIAGSVGTAAQTSAEAFTGADSEGGVYVPIKKANDAPLEKAKITLAAAEDDTDAKATYGAFRITGDCCGTGWTTNDKVTVTVTFDIAPVIPTT